MQSKEERFKKWRGEKASAEHDAFDTALLIDEYINSVDLLATIKADFASLNTPKYLQFNEYNRRSLGILLFCKLTLEESINKIPENAGNPTAIRERKLMAEINDLLSEIYEDYTKDASQRLVVLIAKTKEYLDLDTQNLHDPQQAKRLSFSLYLLLSNSDLALSNLDSWKNKILSRITNFDALTADLQFLLQKTELKVNQINGLVPQALIDKDKKNSRNLKIQEAFDRRFDKLVNIKDGFSVVTKTIAEVTEQITLLSNARSEQSTIAVKIMMMNHLLQAALANKNKIAGRLYFVDFANSHYREFELLLDSLPGYQKTEFKEKIESLRSATISSSVLSLLSWGTAPGTLVFRTIAPQSLQDRVAAAVPSTLDSECKDILIRHAKHCLAELNQELKAKDQEVKSLMGSLAGGDESLHQLIANESSEHLLALVQPYHSASVLIQKYWLASITVNNNVNHLKVLKNASPTLSRFIEVHDGFLVQLSNLFALISPIFKSEMAKTMDSVKDLTNKITHFELNYYKQIKDFTTELDASQDLSPLTKNKLKELVRFDPATLPVPNKPKEVSSEQVQSLITNLTQLFKSTIKMPAPTNPSNPSLASRKLLPAR